MQSSDIRGLFMESSILAPSGVSGAQSGVGAAELCTKIAGCSWCIDFCRAAVKFDRFHHLHLAWSFGACASAKGHVPASKTVTIAETEIDCLHFALVWVCRMFSQCFTLLAAAAAPISSKQAVSSMNCCSEAEQAVGWKRRQG